MKRKGKLVNRKIRSSDKVMNKKLVKLEAKIAHEIATPKYKYPHIGKLSIHYRKRHKQPCIIEGKFYPENHSKTFPPQITIMWQGKYGFIKTFQLKRR